MASRNKRVMKEIQDCERDSKLTQIHIQAEGEDLTRLRGTFPGPTSSPYEGGTFEVAIEVPVRYPFEPLKMRFITKVYHPNVSSQSGAICLDILKDAWSPVLTLKTTLVSLQSLLCSPEPNDPQDAEVAKVYLSDRNQFERTARNWTETYAGGRAHLEAKARSTTNLSSDSTSQSVKTTQLGGESQVERVSSSTGTQRHPSGGSTSTSSNNNWDKVQMGPKFHPDIEDQIRNFALNRDQIRQFENMGFDIDSVMRAMIHVKIATDDDDNSQATTDFSAVLEALLN